MTDSTDVRRWARENGRDVSVRGPLPAAVLRDYEAATQPADDDEPFVDVPAPGIPSVPDVPDTPAEPVKARREEIKPQGKKVSAADKFRQRIQAMPKDRRKRVSIEDVVSGAWALAGFGLTRVDAMIPVGRCLMYQSGVAGVIAEDKLQKTVVDKVLQPLARAGEQGKVVMALVGPPVIVGLMTARPEIAPVARPFLHMAMASWFELAGPAAEKAQKKVEQFQESLGGLDLDALIDSFWSTEGLPVQPSQDEEDAIRRARGDG